MRDAYFDQLDAIIDDLVAMTALVRTAVGRASEALLTPDIGVAEQVISADVDIDAAREKIEDIAFELLALQQPVAGDLRMLVAALRMVDDLERMGDLSVHVAKVARLRMPEGAVPAPLADTITQMAQVAQDMVAQVAEVIADRDVEAARQLVRDDEEMDRLRKHEFEIMLSDDWEHGVEAAVDMALLGRYYERIADHAVSIARRLVYLVTGEKPHSED
ncbi:MAG: phosphate signaling complex protein PhoU [Nocardioidaceae bacterium]|nr:MAG: phosphate signaling complex protein PhoU [Nocardioidaceae bacterium]